MPDRPEWDRVHDRALRRRPGKTAMRETASSVIEFWFGPAPYTDAATIALDHKALWWGKDAAVDAAIKARFEPLLLAAANSDPALSDWTETPQGMLALILLFDQFPRNMYRGAAYAYGYDELARQCCSLGLAQGFDMQLAPIQRVFFYLPLEHAEDVEDQQYSVKLFRALGKQATAGDKATFNAYLDFAVQHSAIIERFGRFPHRNAVLGRDSSAGETVFLSGPGASF